MQAKIMKYHVLYGLLVKFGRRSSEDQDQSELLYGYSLTKTSENNSKSWFILSRICTFLLARSSRQEAAAEGRIDSRACAVNMYVLGEKSWFRQNSVFHLIDF